MPKTPRTFRIHTIKFLNPAIIIPTLVAVLGANLLLIGIFQLLSDYANAGEEEVGYLLMGAMFSLAWLIALLRYGIEVQPKKRRFREYKGILGSKKGDWVEVVSNDYLSIVGVTQSHQATTLRAISAPTVSFVKCKVYFFNENGHIELYKAEYKDARKFAIRVGKMLRVSINDVAQTQNQSTGQSGIGAQSNFRY